MTIKEKEYQCVFPGDLVFNNRKEWVFSQAICRPENKHVSKITRLRYEDESALEVAGIGFCVSTIADPLGVEGDAHYMIWSQIMGWSYRTFVGEVIRRSGDVFDERIISQ
jgi:hypothetical protein